MDEELGSNDHAQPPESAPSETPVQSGYEPPAYIQSAHTSRPSWAMTSTQRTVYGLVVAAVALAIVVTCVVVGARAFADSGTPTPSPSSTSTASGVVVQAGPTATPQPPVPTATPAPTDTPIPTPQPTKVLDMVGSGIKTSGNFDVSGQSQTLDWKCDHSTFGGSDYNVQVYVYDATTHALVQSQDAIPVNVMCQSNYTSDSTQMHLDPGTYYIEVNSEAWWHVTIVDNP